MSPAVRQLLEIFDALPEADKHQAVAEILLRAPAGEQGDLPEAALLKAAEELFATLDREEAEHAKG